MIPETPTFDDVLRARSVLAGYIVRTPTLEAPRLSALTGARVYVKYENMQATGSFKERGAVVRLHALTPQEQARGVVAMSAGNHAQAVACHAARLKIPATIVMPKMTPTVKIENTRAWGARVLIEGETLADAQEVCESLVEREGLTLVHPYDDPSVIAGQGTAALEMLEDAPDLDVLVVPIGGGGLIAGSALAAREVAPRASVVGAEALLYPTFWNALHAGSLPIGGPTLAEGIAVKNVGTLTLAIVRECVKDIVLVAESEIERAVNAFATLQRTMAEGAGAAGLAALLTEPQRFAGKSVGLILCGGNIDARLLAAIMVRELERQNRIVAFRLTAPDRPGLLGLVATLLGEQGANILEVSHRRLMLDVPAKGVSIDVTIEARDAEHVRTVFTALEREGLKPIPI